MKRLALFFFAAACAGTTGGAIVDFPAVVTTPPGVNDFTNDRGWHVTLQSAKLHVGAVYLASAQPVSGAQGTDCILPGTYVAEVTTGLDVDLLANAPQPFPELGHGTTSRALTGQVWLAAGDINQVDDTTPILEIAGTADRAGDVRPFFGRIVIGKNRQSGVAATPGATPICKQRIVSPIPTSIGVGQSGRLRLTIDARLLFTNVDFGQLVLSDKTYVFSDEPGTDGYTQPSINLYQNLHAASALYDFGWDLD